MDVPKTGICPEVEFRYELAEIRQRIERLLSRSLTVDQLVGLGAEMHAHTDSILRDLSDRGLMWRPWV